MYVSYLQTVSIVFPHLPSPVVTVLAVSAAAPHSFLSVSCITCTQTTMSSLWENMKLFIYYMQFLVFLSPFPGASYSPATSWCFCSSEHVSQNVWLASPSTPTTTIKSILSEGKGLLLIFEPLQFYLLTSSSQSQSSCQSAVLVSTACYPVTIACIISCLGPYT